MLNLQQVKGQVAAYASGKISLGEFQDWLHEGSVDPVPPQLEDLVFSLQSALSEYQFDGLSQKQLRTKLQEGAQQFASPFALRTEDAKIVLYQPARHLFAATAAALSAA